MSKPYIPKLILKNIELDPSKAKEVIADIFSGSITPTTIKSRNYENSVDDKFYTQEYGFKSNMVTRFAINNIKIEAKDEKVEGLEAKKQKGGSQSSSNSKTIPKVIYSDVEKNIIYKALEKLFDVTTPVNTVLIDIFERTSGIINLQDDNHPKIHTVVLYKNPTKTNIGNDIVVIDPNNFTYSSHLCYIKDIIEQGKVFKLPQGLDKIITFHTSKLSIYKATNNSIGQKLNQYRECTDISVKLALALNKETNLNIENANQLNKIQILKCISNQKDFDTSIDSEFLRLPIRIKQSSNLEESELFNKVENLIKPLKNNRTQVENKLNSNEKLLSLDKFHKEILEKDNTYQKLLKDLTDLSNQCYKEYDQVIGDTIKNLNQDIDNLS